MMKNIWQMWWGSFPRFDFKSLCLSFGLDSLSGSFSVPPAKKLGNLQLTAHKKLKSDNGLLSDYVRTYWKRPSLVESSWNLCFTKCSRWFWCKPTPNLSGLKKQRFIYYWMVWEGWGAKEGSCNVRLFLRTRLTTDPSFFDGQISTCIFKVYFDYRLSHNKPSPNLMALKKFKALLYLMTFSVDEAVFPMVLPWFTHAATFS